jgi:hypothetical protein
MGWPSRRRREHSDRPLPGFKLAYPMLSADGTAAGFSGLTIGRAHVYRRVADAVCGHGFGHASPARGCDCGFYCFHELGPALDLACEPEYRGAVLLEVAASGRYRRHERGLRYSRQRVRTVRIGRCDCGRPADVLADSGTGVVGWRRLVPVCGGCAGRRPVLAPATFGRLVGGEVGEVTVMSGGPPPGPLAPLAGKSDGGAAGDPDAAGAPGAVAVLTAEVALLQARLDELAARLDALDK